MILNAMKLSKEEAKFVLPMVRNWLKQNDEERNNGMQMRLAQKLNVFIHKVKP
jgi:hypothetical protein